MTPTLIRAGLAAALSLSLSLPAAVAQEPGGVNDGNLRRPGSSAEPEARIGSFFAAAVRGDGVLRSGAGALSAARAECDAGCYEVLFRKSDLHRNCWWTATIADRTAWTVPSGLVGVDARATSNNGLFVQTFAPDGTRADRPFILTVLCR
ncbi:MAG: hypothetical protein KJZ85_15250 [Rhodobacteraceae bacterium]|jgi:hypothetical protein|nr:hypothetical protein [Paracoccaceae bacterium]